MALRRGIPALRRLARPVDPAVDPLPLRVEDVLELPAQVAEDVAEIVSVEQLPALAAKPLQEIAKPRHLVARPGLESTPEEALERAARIAVGHQVVGHGRQEIVGVEVRQGLRSVPAGNSGSARCRRRRARATGRRAGHHAR